MDKSPVLHHDEAIGQRRRFERIVGDEEAETRKRRQVPLEIATNFSP